MLTVWYGITSFIFGILLFFPLRKLMMALNINKFQAKNKRAITEEEKQAIRKKVNVIAGIIAMSFAFFYNKYMVIKFFQP